MMSECIPRVVRLLVSAKWIINRLILGFFVAGEWIFIARISMLIRFTGQGEFFILFNF